MAERISSHPPSLLVSRIRAVYNAKGTERGQDDPQTALTVGGRHPLETGGATMAVRFVSALIQEPIEC